MSQINLGYYGYSDSRLETSLGATATAMTGNANFTVTAELTAAKAALAAFVAALADAASGDRVKAAIKNQKKEEAINAFVTMGRTVMVQAEDDEAKLVSSGYPLRKGKTPSGPLMPSEFKKLQQGVNSGTIDAVWTRQKGAALYELQYQEDGATEWTGRATTQTKMTIAGLVPGKLYWFRVIVYGVREQEVIGNAVPKYIS